MIGKYFCIFAVLTASFTLARIIESEKCELEVYSVVEPINKNWQPEVILASTFGGCHRWVTDRPDLLRMWPFGVHHIHQCAEMALLSKVTNRTDPFRAGILVSEYFRKDHIFCVVLVHEHGYDFMPMKFDFSLVGPDFLSKHNIPEGYPAIKPREPPEAP